MLTKTKIALAVALLAGSVTVAAADGYDPNLANRYGRPVARAPYGAFQSAPVRLQKGSTYLPATNPPVDEVNQNDWYNTDARDKASSPYAGGGGL